MRRLFLVLALSLSAASLLWAGDQLWLQSGTSGPGAEWPPHDFQKEEEKKRPIEEGVRETFKLKNGFTAAVTCRERTNTRYTIEVELFDAAGRLLSARAALAKQSPIVIRGPSSGGRSPLLVLWVR